MNDSGPLVFVGVDPGAIGGIAVICGGAVSAVTMPRSDRSMYDHFTSVMENATGVVAAIEQVGGYIKGNPAPGSAMFEFGQNYGALRMAMVARGLEITKGDPGTGRLLLTPPQEWQRGLGIDPKRKSEGDTDWKNRLKWNAEQLFPRKQYPSLKITLRTADALLIVSYLKRRYTTGY